MAITLDEMEAQRDALQRAIRSGAFAVKHGDKSVTYRSLGELQAALDDVQDAIAAENGTKRSRFRYSKTGRGL